ncbi:MAG: hypothetical protein HY914_15265 [Desulfomonile tiedjei]|nr:hypothetical protein [Desulfomonile tiedjei]
MGRDDDKTIKELDKNFELLLTNASGAANLQRMKQDDRIWRVKDPIGYKKDMEDMCRAMFGEAWLVEYEALLRDEFPEEFEKSD